jgi:hypothetical protein
MYQKYDNYDAIEVSKTKHIPYDYAGCMGVPISFLEKWNPNQFKLNGMPRLFLLKKVVFSRVIIKNLHPIIKAKCRGTDFIQYGA